jgi:hypothetical protein
MAEKITNDFATTLSAAIVSTSATSISVSASAPAALQGGQFRMRIGAIPTTETPNPAYEIIIVTATGANGATPWTVTRGAEGTTAITHVNGTPITHIFTAGAIQQIIADVLSGNGGTFSKILLPNVTVTDEANAVVNVIQFGEDASGTIKEQHITSADQTGTGTGAPITMNPGTSAGSNQDGAALRIAGGMSTGNGGGSSVTIMTSGVGASGSSTNPQADSWHFWGGNLTRALTPATDGTQDIGYPSLRCNRLYLKTGIVVTSPDGNTIKTIGINNAGAIVAT